MNGVINVYKERNFTSHDVVAKLRGILKQKKIGHTGTLDPDATGVLPVCLGKATKLCDVISTWDKSYRATLLLGKETDTEDTSGQVLKESEVNVTEEEIRQIIHSFIGTYGQIPPMYSAKKVQGKKLYELAREGKVIERKPCQVTITSIEIIDVDLPYITFDVSCSKGTYIRSLCRDIGEKAGCGGCMSKLIRTRVSDFQIEDAITLSEVENYRDSNQLTEYIRSIDSVFPFYPAVLVGDKGTRLLMNGNTVPIRYTKEISSDVILDMTGEEHEDMYRIYDKEQHFIGLYKKDEEKGVYKPEKLFFDL
ncbi:MAG: tRNA pseudouridine(55) synthase TruB [Eubacteriales bacterium]|nr:tRNA pseudouridine(55) synthase TruB [Eubacteriales bacterium]